MNSQYPELYHEVEEIEVDEDTELHTPTELQEHNLQKWNGSMSMGMNLTIECCSIANHVFSEKQKPFHIQLNQQHKRRHR